MTMNDRRTVMLTVLMVLSMAPHGVVAQLFRPFSDRRPGVLLEGNWQSCQEWDANHNPVVEDGRLQYAERVYDGKWAGLPLFEFHMGPYREFALFKGIQDIHRDHDSGENLLKPHKVEFRANKAKQTWNVEGLHIEVAMSGGSREDCESWYVTIKRSETTSSSF